MGLFKKIKYLSRFSLLKSIYFNFHYLPFGQAIHLPILFRKPKFLSLKGDVKIILDEGQKLKTGLIQLGTYSCSIYPDMGMTFENHGGTITFRGRASVGNFSAISVGEKGVLDFGAEFKNTAALRIACYHRIEFAPWVRFGWDCLVMDSDMHSFIKLKNGKHTKGYSPIKIGRGCWIGTHSLVMKGTVLPPYVTVSAGSKTGKAYDVPQDCVIGNGKDLDILIEGLRRDHEHFNDIIVYPDPE